MEALEPCTFCGKVEPKDRLRFSFGIDAAVHVNCCRENLPKDSEDKFNHTAKECEALLAWGETQPFDQDV